MHTPHQPSDDDFENAVVVLANEPAETDGIAIAATELRLCAPEPLRLVVLLRWRVREQDGQPRSAHAIWEALTELGMYGDDGESPVALDDVRRAVDFLLAEGLVTSPSASDGAL